MRRSLITALVLAVPVMSLAAPAGAQNTVSPPPPGVQAAPFPTTATPPYVSPGTAPGPRQGRFIARFQAANVTRDGKLTLEQARQAHMGNLVRHFDEIDQTHQGYVTLAQIRDYRRQMRTQRGTQVPPRQ